MPDLGKYETAVLGAYGVAIALIVALVAVSLIRSAISKRQLTELEERRRKNG